MNYSLFIYGTLMNPQIFKEVTSYKRSEEILKLAQEATLMGFKAVYADGELFPGLKKIEGALVHGLVIEVPKELLNFLIKYEDPEYYDLVEVAVSTLEGRLINASLFLNTPLLKLTDHSWDYKKFMEKGENLQVLSRIEDWMS